MVACMSDRGWEVSTDYSNGVFPTDVTQGIPAQQASQYDDDLDECTALYGFDQPRIPTQEQMEELYELETVARQCVIDEGYDLPPMPSLATFTESYGTGEGWDLTGEVARSVRRQKQFSTRNARLHPGFRISRLARARRGISKGRQRLPLVR